ncbi:MAG: alpha-L-rhamnosidase [Chlorobi bacterium]|nr:alpha-L-rhamnosidase [Chlorobiota bacterium]
MKKHFILLLILLAACSSDNNNPTGLMVEFIRQPEQIEVLDSKPEFSWIVPIDTKHQTAYQIQVSSTRSKLEKDEADIWNSGVLRSNRSVEVECGSVLKPNTAYYWRVKIWNDKYRPTPYSDIQNFTTGKLENYATTKNSFMSNLIEPKVFDKISDSHFFIDFGKDAFGTLLFSNLKSSTSDTLIIHLGEKADGNSVDRDPGGSIRYQKVKLPIEPGKTEYLLKLPANKRNTSGAAVLLPDSMGVIIPFRYCEIENSNAKLSSADIRQKVFTYYFNDNESYFESSDTILNQVWDLCKYSIKATSFTGLYVDGDRERIPYEADAYINQLGHYYTDREYSMARRTNEYFIDHPTWPTEWILHTVPMFYNDFMFTGNLESVKYFYENLKSKTLIDLAREDDLISSQRVTDEIMTKLGFANPKARIKDIVDWPPGQKDTGWKLARPEGERDGYEFTPINTVVNAFHYQNLKIMSDLAEYLGKTEDAKFYKERAEKVKNSINEKLFNKEKGIYTDGETSEHSSLHANMFPLAFGIVPDKYKKSVVKFIKSRGMACSVYGAQYLLEALYKAGEAEYAFNLLTATNDRSWWNMIKSGSTITMEAWDKKYKPNTDWNHAWGAAPANIIPGMMWGIKPVKPGFSKTEIKPQLDGLKYSKIVVPTIRGKIAAEYKNEGNSKMYTITIPGNMECNFIPIDKNKTIYFNGEKLKSFTGIIKLFPGISELIIE